MIKVNIPNQLPYEFDSYRLWRAVLRGFLAFEVLIVIPGLLKFIIVKEIAGIFGMLITGLLLLMFMVLIAKHSEGANGIITANEVLIRPNSVLRKQVKRNNHRLSITDFVAICVTIRPPVIDSHLETARVLLVAAPGGEDVILDTGTVAEGKQLGAVLHKLLGLPYQEQVGEKSLW